MTRLLAGAVLALAAACTMIATDGPDAQGYRWERVRAPLPATVHRGTDVFLRCGLEPHAQSCARRDDAAGRCDVYLPPDPAPWQEPHERRHCEGWMHPSALD